MLFEKGDGTALGDEICDMDIIGLWSNRLEKTEGWASEQDMSSILSEQNLIKSAVSAIGKRRRRKLGIFNV